MRHTNPTLGQKGLQILMNYISLVSTFSIVQEELYQEFDDEEEDLDNLYAAVDDYELDQLYEPGSASSSRKKRKSESTLVGTRGRQFRAGDCIFMPLILPSFRVSLVHGPRQGFIY